MAVTLRSSRLAAMVESTEGTLIIPTSGANDYLAMQDDFTMGPETSSIENGELKSSIGKAKSIVGVESPKASFSHYLRGSAVAGTAPDFSELVQAAFGTEVIASAERDLVSSSTISVLNVDTGEGSGFQRGDICLVQDATNGYSLRPVHSVSTDALTLGFTLPGAPASGTLIGRSILYKPADSGHQSLSLWHYGGNGGFTQAMAGSRVTNMSVTAKVGDLLNVNYSLEGTAYYFNPIVITSSTKYIDWTENSVTKVAILTAKAYKSPDELASAIQTAMQAASSFTITCVYSDTTGKYTITYTGTGAFSILFNTGSNTANTIATKIGFTVADKTGAVFYTSTSAQDLTPPQTASYDSSDPLVVKNMECFLGDSTDSACFGASSFTLTMATPSTKIQDICAETGIASSIIGSREVSVEIISLLAQYNVDKYTRFLNNSDTRCLLNFGTKSGGNWVKTKCGHIYLPSATVSSFSVDKVDGVAVLKLTVKAYVDSSGNGEVYLALT